MRVLGLCAGNPEGSAEILLKAALKEAAGAGAEVALVRLDDLWLPNRPLAPGNKQGTDDGPWLWDQVMECDGLIVSTPIYSRTVPGTLKLAADRLAGPAADVAFAENYRSMLERGETPVVAFPYDERIFRPRVAGLIAVGGAIDTQWTALALPMLHQMMFSSHIAVADQLLVHGAGMPRSVVLDDDAMAGAARVGASVGSQLGRDHDDVEYRGEPGVCPLCHLSMIVVRDDLVECATCGAGGRIVVDGDDARIVFDNLDRSVVSMAEKRAHFAEVQETAGRQRALTAEIDERTVPYAAWDPRVTP